jgi:diguanylate cyclase (GGDEF)-like protein
MVTVISRFRVRNGLEDQVRQAFLERQRLVEHAIGFHGLEVLTDSTDPSIFLLVTRWTSEGAYRAWHGSGMHHMSHALIPRGLKLDASFTQIVVGNRIEEPRGVSNLSDALEGRTFALAHWLKDADTVFALIFGPDGTIRTRNRAADVLFPGPKIWDSLICSDAESLQQRLSEPASQSAAPFRLNITDGQKSPMTMEVSLVDCTGGYLLVGAVDQRHSLRLQHELQILNNQLSTMAREVARKNKELEGANRTIQHIARTDALTGLMNRGTLNEMLPLELARAQRQNQPLTLVLGDVDHFKAINDTFGHVVGDRVLTAVGKLLSAQVRPYDLAARFGGEEFVLLFPGAACMEGVQIADRLRTKIGSLQIPGGPERMTISFGVATWMKGESTETLVARADAALYRAKHAGRDRVEADEVLT